MGLAPFIRKSFDVLTQIGGNPYERFNDVAFYEVFDRIYYTGSHKYFNAQEDTVYLCNKLLRLEIILLKSLKYWTRTMLYFFDHMIICKAVNIYFGQH